MLLRKIGKVLLYACAGFLALILLLMLAVKVALDRAPRYQAEIKEWVNAQIGYRIAFAHVSPAFRWYGPELFFDHLELRSKDDRRVLARAAGGRVGADIWQFLSSGKLLAGRIELDAPTISITRLGEDKFSLASEIELGGGDSALSTAQLEDLPAVTIAIRHGRVAVQSWNEALPQLELDDVTLELRRGDGVATFAATANLPKVLGGEISVNGSAQGAGALDTLDWTAVARARNLALAGWRELLPQYLSRLGGGTGSFELTARGRGAGLARAELDCSAADVTTQLGDLPVVKFEQVAGAFTLVHAAQHWALFGRRVRALRDGLRDRDSQFDASWRDSDAGLLELRVQASYLRAETLLPLAGLLPQKDLRERLQEAAPTGEWLDAHIDLKRRAVDAAWQLAVGARFRGVGFAAVGRAPGLRGLDGSIAGTDQGGRVEIESSTGMLSWPMQLAQPIPLERIKTTLYWKRTPAELLVATPSVTLKTRDADGQAQMSWRLPTDGGAPLLTLVAAVDNGNAAATHLYLPRALLHPNVIAWLDRAFVAGHLSHADVVIDGPIRHFPFRDGTGRFFARARLGAVTLDYHEGWPRAENLAFVAEFRNEGMTAQLDGGTMGGLDLQKGDLRFADLKTAELEMHIAGRGDAADALAFLRSTPLDELADHLFSAAEAKGPVQAEVDLDLPFKDFDHRRILVHTHLHGVSLSTAGASVAATELMGDADVDGGQVSRAELRGKLLGGTFQVQARSPRTRPLTRTQLIFNGMLTGDALHSALGLPAGMLIGGTTDWHGVLHLSTDAPRERSLRLNGNLAGLDFDMPEPLDKPAGVALPTTVEVQWPANGGAELHLTMGSVLRGRATLASGANGLTLDRAAVTFGAAAPETPLSDTQTLNTAGTLDRLDLTGWLRLYAPDKNSAPLSNFLRTAKFDVARIDYLGLSFADVTLDLGLTDAGWRIGVGGPNVAGSISVPGAADSIEPWKLEFKRLKFTEEPVSSGAAVGNAPPRHAGPEPAAANPRRIPAVNFHCAETIWGERQFGDVRATLGRLDDGISLKQLAVAASTFTVEAKGEWRGRDAGTARIVGTLSSSDVGGTLKQLGYDAVLEAKTGKIDFDMSWLGAPAAEALSLATGKVQVALDRGQITGLKPGAGRVVGLASIAALPRRLALDFSDLTDKGFAFDTVRGEFDLRDGSAFTDDVLVKGPAAEIGLIGRVGLKARDYDQTAVVTGNVGNTLPLAAFAGGPVIGAAVLVFAQVFKQPLKGLARGYYRITGSWDNPSVERIKSADAATATAEVPK